MADHVALQSKICVIADVHSNLAAMKAVVQDAGEVDAWWCLGDVVGYGPDPNECTALAAEIDALCVAGNHDVASLGRMSLGMFNIDARASDQWTSTVLDESSARFLESLPQTRSACDGLAFLVHGSPRDPLWEYILNSEEARDNFGEFENDVCFCGHTHMPVVFAEKRVGVSGEGTGTLVPEDGEWIELAEDSRYIVNVGSVGQPRDSDPRACYAVFEPLKRLVTYYRVAYQVEQTQERMEELGLPVFLIKRLALGR